MGSSTIRTTASPMPSSMVHAPSGQSAVQRVCHCGLCLLVLYLNHRFDFQHHRLEPDQTAGRQRQRLGHCGIIISVAKLGIYLLLIVMIIVGLFSGMVDAVTNDLRSDYSYSRYDDMDDQYDSYYYDGQYDYDDSGDIDIDDLDRALEQLNGVSEWSPAFTVYSPAVSISE